MNSVQDEDTNQDEVYIIIYPYELSSKVTNLVFCIPSFNKNVNHKYVIIKN